MQAYLNSPSELVQLIVWGFWGRRRTVRILHSYVQRNMQRVGGLISQASAATHRC